MKAPKYTKIGLHFKFLFTFLLLFFPLTHLVKWIYSEIPFKNSKTLSILILLVWLFVQWLLSVWSRNILVVPFTSHSIIIIEKLKLCSLTMSKATMTTLSNWVIYFFLLQNFTYNLKSNYLLILFYCRFQTMQERQCVPLYNEAISFKRVVLFLLSFFECDAGELVVSLMLVEQETQTKLPIWSMASI